MIRSDNEEKKHEALPIQSSAENPGDGLHQPPASLPSSPPPSSSAAGNAEALVDKKESALDVSSDDVGGGDNFDEKAARGESPEQPLPQQAMDANPTAEDATTAPPAKLKPALKSSTNTIRHDDDPSSDTPNVARICGRSASSCGYCRGSRTWVLSVKEEGQTNNDGEQDTSATSMKRVEEVSDKTEEQDSNGSNKSATLQDDDSNGLHMETDSNNDSNDEPNETASVAYGLIFASLSPTCYQQLIDTAWRRSGNHLYKPDNFNSCCPALSIRLNVQRYRASKSQRRVEKRLMRYLSGGDGGVTGGTNSAERRDANSNRQTKKKGGDDALSNPTEILASLQSETIAAVRSYNGATSQKVAINDIDDNTLNKLCTFKIRNSIPKVALNSLLREETFPSGGQIAAISTTACAAVGGRSKGKIEASSLANHVVEQLANSTKNIAAESGTTLFCVKAEKGGRVAVYLCATSKESNSTNGSDKATSMEADAFDVRRAPTLKREESQSVGVVADFLRKAQLEMPESYGQGENQTKSNSQDDPYVLTVRSVPSQISASQPEVHRLFAKYQTQIHGDKDCFAPAFGDTTAIALSNKRIQTDYDDDLDASLSDDEDRDDDESTWQRDIYDVDKVYAHMNLRTRMRIKKGYANFHRFLCETPLPLVRPDGDGDRQFQIDDEGYDINIPFGSYHQQYRINGVLIAVGVVDVLPHCLSSVYAFYDPDLSRHLELGKYTALREIEWVKRACAHRRELRYYYLGYYIRSCIKMVYKAEYKPSELLCPTTNRWVDFEIAKNILDERSPVRQCCTLFLESVPKENNKEDERHSNSNRSSLCRNSFYTEEHKSALVDSMLLDIGGVGGQETPPITVSMLNPEGRAMVDPLIKEFIDEVGFDVSRRCIIRLN